MPKGWPRLKETKETETEKPAPGAVVKVTPKEFESFEVVPKVEYQWLRIPHGTFDYQSSQVRFRAENAPSNKALIDGYHGLLSSGYEIRQFEVDAQYMYLLFERRNA